MQLTPEQQKRINEAKSAGEKRIVLDFTPGQEAEWEMAVQQELAGKDENLEHLRKMKAAAEQEGFSGDLRRAITLARRPIRELAVEIGVDWRVLSDFRAGDAELPSPALDRLIAVLGLRLMREIRLFPAPKS
jgi:hypothetical protein